jgi:hypothetical protein
MDELCEVAILLKQFVYSGQQIYVDWLRVLPSGCFGPTYRFWAHLTILFQPKSSDSLGT